jgi:hypothetical protein
MDTSMVVVGGFVLIWTIGYLLGLAYLKGGATALRRVLPRVALIVPVLIVVLVFQGVVSQAVGSITVGLVLLPVVLIVLVGQIRRLRHLGAARDAGGAQVVTPAMRSFAVVAFVVLIVGTILLSFLAARAGR